MMVIRLAVFAVVFAMAACAHTAAPQSLQARYDAILLDAPEPTPSRPASGALAQLGEDAVAAARAAVAPAEQMAGYGLAARVALWTADDPALAVKGREWVVEGRRQCALDGVAEAAPRECGVLQTALALLEGEQALARLADAPLGTEAWAGARAADAAKAVSDFRLGAAADWAQGAARLAALESRADEDLARWWALSTATQFCLLRNRAGVRVIEASQSFFPTAAEDAATIEAITRDYRAIRAEATAVPGWWTIEPSLADADDAWSAPDADDTFEAYATTRCTLLFEERGALTDRG